MATTFFGTVKIGSSSLSLDVLLLKTADNTAETGLTYSSGGLSAYYYRQGDSATTSISLVDRSTLNAAYSSGGFKEIGDGSYRLDAPDAMWATGAQWVELTVKTADSLYKERFTLEAHGADDIYAALPSVPTVEQIRQEMDTNSTKLANLDAAVSTRSTYAGGAVASVTGAVGSVAAPVTVGTITDKTGYKLAADGLDSVVIETGINARQALSLVLCAAPAGILSGAGTSTVTVKNPAGNANRVVATVDSSGNRTAVTLTPPT